MLGHREMTLEDYVGILRRRLWWIVVPTVILPLVTYGLSLLLKDRYTSQTLVLVEQQKVPDSFVRPVITEDLNARLSTMQEQILSRTRLQPIIERFGLYAGEKIPMDDKVERMRKAISVTPVRSVVTATNGLPGFSIAFTADDARLAQQVCGEIASMFMSENLRAREQTAQGTTEFLRAQLEEAKRKLDDQDRKLAAFQRQYIGQLPGQEQMNFGIYEGLNKQLEANTQALNRLQQDKTYAETMLNQQIAAWKSMQSTNSPVTLEQQLAALQSQLVSLEGRYTADHPDVLKAKRDIELLKKKLSDTPPPAPEQNENAVKIEPASVQQLRAQVRNLELSVQEKLREQQNIQKQIKVYAARIEMSPKVQEQYKSITRDYNTALGFYNELLAKKNQSEMATDLEKRQQGEQFRVMDPPNLPATPTYPNRMMFAAGGLAGGLVLGVLLALGLEFKDKSLRTEGDIEWCLELPTLAQVPRMDLAHMPVNGDTTGKRWLWRRGSKASKQEHNLVGA